MTGPKTNETATKRGERVGTRCVVRHVRSAPSKARQVLDLIRGLDVRTADQVLQFTEREIARTIRKALASAVANAVNNDEQDADELKVVACFADETTVLVHDQANPEHPDHAVTAEVVSVLEQHPDHFHSILP